MTVCILTVYPDDNAKRERVVQLMMKAGDIAKSLLKLYTFTLSDISDGNGQTVNKDIMAGQRPITANLLEPGLDNNQ